ncbi:MAG: hypothetical protein U0992_06565 [Planctomycetaceae bacterium]
MDAWRVAFPDSWNRSAGVRGFVRCPHNARALHALRAAGLLVALVWTTALQAATVATRNFVVHAQTEDIARQVGQAAEHYRKELAVAWLGQELPNWYRPCPIKVKVGQIGAGGATTFTFEGGEVFGWNMNVQGTLERILDSVIPHEVSHTIFASYFRRPLPRWADEGAATLVEHESERLRQSKLLNQVLSTNRRIPLQRLLEITEYPEDMHQVLTLYAEGYSLADFLVQQHGEQGRAKYLQFLADAHQHDWAYAFKKYYGFGSLRDVEQKWTGWVLAGSPPLPMNNGDALLADAGATAPHSEPAANNVASAAPAQPRTAAAPPTPLIRLEPLPTIQRQLRSRVSGSDLNAPEPKFTAMPTVDAEIQLGESAVQPETDAARPADANQRPVRPSIELPLTGSLREVNAGYDDAFQR